MGWPGQPSLRRAHLWYTTSWLAEPGRPANQFLVHNVVMIQIIFVFIIIIIIIISSQLWGPPDNHETCKNARFYKVVL